MKQVKQNEVLQTQETNARTHFENSFISMSSRFCDFQIKIHIVMYSTFCLDTCNIRINIRIMYGILVLLSN